MHFTALQFLKYPIHHIIRMNTFVISVTTYVSSKLITDKILWALEDSLWPLQIS